MPSEQFDFASSFYRTFIDHLKSRHFFSVLTLARLCGIASDMVTAARLFYTTRFV